jgi:hypothetical protein
MLYADADEASIAVLYDTEYPTQHVIEFQRSICIRHAMLALLTEGPQYGLRLPEEPVPDA